MAAQAFFYNAIFFTYALVLARFFSVPSDQRRLAHPAVRCRQFPGAAAARAPVRRDGGAERCWRSPMAFPVSCCCLAAPVPGPVADGDTQTIGWMIVFFFASAAASSAYLTVAENFRWRFAPWPSPCSTPRRPRSAGWPRPICSDLVAAGSRTHLFFGYLFAAALMLAAALVAWVFAVDAEGKSLEEVAPPLSSVN